MNETEKALDRLRTAVTRLTATIENLEDLADATGEVAEALDDVPDPKSFCELRERYNYLAKGGKWGVSVTTDAYLAGFEDAMRVLGVTP